MNDSPRAPLFETSHQEARSWPRGIRSLRFKAALLVVIVLVSVTSVGTGLSNWAIRLVFYQNEYGRTQEWANSLASSTAEAVEDHNIDSLKQTASDLINRTGMAYLAFVDKQGNHLASAEVSPGLLDTNQLQGSPADLLPKINKPKLIWHESRSLACAEVIVPIYAKKPVVTGPRVSRPIVGFLCLARDVTETKAELETVSSKVSRIGLGLVLLAIPSSLLVTRYVVKPLNELAQTARAIADGSTDARAQINSEDEIGELARSFNVMADRLTRSQAELLELNAELEERVQERTRELEELASKDPLTGLYNRRYFSEVMAREFAAAERYDADLTCLMFDLDHFKEANDTFGHRTGDEVLCILAGVISSELRTSDVPTRFGGDEFAVLLPQTSAPSASMLVKRIANRFNREVRERFPEIPVGVSIGVASLRTTRVSSAEALLHEADVALYAAKQGGRNRVAEASSQPDTPADPQPTQSS